MQSLRTLLEVCVPGLFGRFPVAPPNDDKMVNKTGVAKWLKRIAAPKLFPQTEKDVKNWADNVGKLAKKLRPSVHVLQLITATVADLVTAGIADEAEVKTFEKLIDHICITLFPGSEYVIALEDELWPGRRCASTIEARRWLQNGIDESAYPVQQRFMENRVNDKLS